MLSKISKSKTFASIGVFVEKAFINPSNDIYIR
jgi:hypothetical protein